MSDNDWFWEIFPPDDEGQRLAEHYRDVMSADRELTEADQAAIHELLTRDD